MTFKQRTIDLAHKVAAVFSKKEPMSEENLAIKRMHQFECDLFHAAKRGGLKLVKELLERRADPNAPMVVKQFMLYLASRYGHAGVVKLMIENGADVNKSCDPFNLTPLMWAAMYGRTDVVRLLIEKGANVHAMDNEKLGHDALYHACFFGYRHKVDAARLLIENGADVNKLYLIGSTPLIAACMSGSIEMVRILIQKGADPNLRGETYPNGRYKYGTALHYAATHFEYGKVKFLIAAGADIEARNEWGETPLISATRSGNLDVIKALVEAGAKVNAKDSSGDAPLHYACGWGFTDVAEYLLKHGADVNAVGVLGWTPLDRVVGNDQLDEKRAGKHKMERVGCNLDIILAHLLIAHGANIADPRYLAAASGHEPVARLLRQASAQPS